ncbi:hypothetical protein ZYGR_0AS03330 [Zygosaccharomyces rouxii]|uniref:Uncharacterized protein n=1 Tax=Zygosaccharomyces rouxii TaxID=4956 RepID=A0A1Q3AH89_ZYGRO|nr:hypothetical protein ZYGR_0AS03330 [Zygosaccharomyces rouxii]
MLVTLDRFSSRIFLKQCRGYAKSVKKPLSWELVFDQKTPRSKAILVFKQKLSESIENRSVAYTSNPHTKKALDALIQRSSISELSFEKSVLSLYKLILQRRIPDDEVYDVISQVSAKNVVNVAIPSSSSPNNVDDIQEKPSLHIHPEQKDHMGEVIKEIGNQGKPITKGDLFQNQEVKCETSPSHSHIDVGSLQKFLHKAEQEKNQKKYAWEGTRLYNWDLNLNDSPRLTAGSLIFAHKSKPSRRSVSKLLQRSTEKTRHDSQAQKKPKDLLIYNLEKRSEVVLPASHTNSIFNINYRDLFGVINGSGRTPEETLAVINQLETKGWQLIGDLYDNSQNVVFQRTVGSAGESEDRVSYRIPLISVTALLVVLGIYYESESRKKAKESDYHERV